jgi:hypothetical protein
MLKEYGGLISKKKKESRAATTNSKDGYGWLNIRIIQIRICLKR